MALDVIVGVVNLGDAWDKDKMLPPAHIHLCMASNVSSEYYMMYLMWR